MTVSRKIGRVFEWEVNKETKQDKRKKRVAPTCDTTALFRLLCRGLACAYSTLAWTCKRGLLSWRGKPRREIAKRALQAA